MSTSDSTDPVEAVSGSVTTQPAETGPFTPESLATIANEFFHALQPAVDAGEQSAPVDPTSELVEENSLSTVADLGTTAVPGAPSLGTTSTGALGLGVVDSENVSDPFDVGTSLDDLGSLSGLSALTGGSYSVPTTGDELAEQSTESTELSVSSVLPDGFSLPDELTDGLDVTTLLGKAAETPTNEQQAVDAVAGDHPFLQSKYEAVRDYAGVDDEGLGDEAAQAVASDEFAAIASEFTGEHVVDPAISDLLRYTDHAADTVEEPNVHEPVEAASTEATFGKDATIHESTAAPDRVALHGSVVESSVTDEHADSDGYVFAPNLLAANTEPEHASDLELPQTSTGFNPEQARKDFPILSERINGQELVWLDNGATSQKPQQVIDRISYFYEHENSNVHRTAHTLAGRATDAYEGARDKVRAFINAPSADEVVWVRGTTEGMNLLANTIGEQRVGEGDEVVISWLEHHANIVPWQMLCRRKGATLKVAPVDDTGQVILSEFERLITDRTKLVSFTQVSNALGTITPAKEMIEIAHRHEVPVILDGAQGILHMPVDVQELGCDFYVFSGHKMFAPTGIGVVWGKSEFLDDMPPWQGGGNMIDKVYFDRTTYQKPPWRFEAGTGSIADAVGLGAAIDYLQAIGMSSIAEHEHDLLQYSTRRLKEVPGLTIFGNAQNKAAVMSFNIEGHEPEDVGSFLDQRGIAVRAGHHCAQPILRRFGVEGTVRAAFALYNTRSDVDRLVDALIELVGGRTVNG